MDLDLDPQEARVTARGTSRPARPSQRTKHIATALVVLAVAWAVLTVDVRIERLPRLPGQLANIFSEMFLRPSPEWEYFGRAFGYMMESVQIAWLGTIIGAFLSLPLAFFGAKNITSPLVSNIIRQLLNAIRAIPEILVAVVVFIPMVGLGAYPGMLAIGVHSVGTLGKLAAEVIEGINPGPVEAARAAGGNPLQIQRWGVLPQVLPEIVAFWLYRFEINIRASAILGAVGAGGVGEALVQSLVYRRYERAGMLIIVIIVVTILIDTASGWLRRRIIEGGDRPSKASVSEQPELAELREESV
ncbi:MAG TPA: phosphonate ABC transporter, permease protein PhnE [Candidatus Binatia bacterium]|nr:phosphonate ABC transporter, permease protein PhnE [Candidatus Binatia bacterium]